MKHRQKGTKMGVSRNTIQLYWAQMRKHKPTFFIGLFFVPLSTLCIDTLLPFAFSLAIGSLTTEDEAGLTRSLMFAGIIGVTGLVLNFIGFQLLIRHEARVRTGLYNDTFRGLINKDLQFFVNEKVGALTSRFIDFIRAHVALQDLLILRTLSFVLSVGIGLAIVATQAPLVALILAALISLMLLQIKWFTKIRAPYRKKRKELIASIHGEAADSITNSLMVKTFANENSEIHHLERQTKELERIFIKDISIFGLDGTIRNVIMTVAQLVGIAICAYLVLNGQLSLAIAVFAITYLQRIAMQIFGLGEILNGYDESLLQAAPMTEMLMQENSIVDAPMAKDIVITQPTIKLDTVSYSYPDNDEEVLRCVSIDIQAGEKIGLVGRSGAGKTTITHLLLRFSDVTSGQIRISDVDIRDITQQSLRRAIAYVPQEPMLFHRSLRENIAYGRLDATDAEISAAAKKANALGFIDKLPHGLDTLVGERGVKLSGGQRQRVAIARAILKDAPILILDEATSALDSESEKLIQDALDKLMHGRTSIVIAHRLSTIAKLDRIIVLDEGRIVEQGTHTDLLADKGIYAKLWAHQSGGFIEE